jgi:beta-barrel assembly-enhancing protease
LQKEELFREGIVKANLNLTLILLAAICAVSNAFAQDQRRFGDVQNIGNRTVGGFSDAISSDKESAAGASLAADFEKSLRLINNRAVTEYIDRLGQNLVKHSDAKMPCYFRVIDVDYMDLMAILGGRIYINKGLITAADNEAELAGAMAYGIAHVAARHASRLLDEGKALHISAIPALFSGHWSSLAKIWSAVDLDLAPAQYKFEEEADQLAVQYLWNSNYEPGAYATLLQKLLKRENELPIARPRLSLMPATQDRIAASAEEINRLPSKNGYVLDTPEFERIKDILLQME